MSKSNKQNRILVDFKIKVTRLLMNICTPFTHAHFGTTRLSLLVIYSVSVVIICNPNPLLFIYGFTSPLVTKTPQSNYSPNPIFHTVQNIHQFKTISSTKSISTTKLHGIRGFRAWFESQFPDAMITLKHPHPILNKSNTKKKTQQNSAYNNTGVGGGENIDKQKIKDDDWKKSRKDISSSTSNSTDTFHHVLIDVNQLLHVSLRRSRTQKHALTLIIQELDKCTSIAQPTRSIVLAFDGPPAAAKLATQRRRRYSVVQRSQRQQKRYQRMVERGVVMLAAGGSSGSTSRKSRERVNSILKSEKDEETLMITPGTFFMEQAHNAVLYWAWQRLSNPKGKLSNCKIYISPSTVPGEGEVKLLDWLIQAGDFSSSTSNYVNGSKSQQQDHIKRIVKPGDSVAIMGGDSDLVLEGLVIPPSITHNIFVILPAGGRMSYAVSLWETTRTLGRFLSPHLDNKDIMRVRTDLVLLLIMNGNDYLPKLRGSSGFNKLFHTYLRILKQWLKEERKALDPNNRSTEKEQTLRPFLIDPDTLEFNIPFCITFFQKLANIAPKYLAQPSEMLPHSRSITPLSHLYSMIDSGFLPGPATFSRSPVTEKDGTAKNEEVILTLGALKNNSTEECSMKSNCVKVSTLHRLGKSLKKTKQLLANMALEQILGKDYMDLNDYVLGNQDDDNNLDGDDDYYDDEDDDEENDFEYNIDGDTADEVEFGSSLGMGGYSWEINLPAASNVDEYLKGLIWNLATYQDGVCANYAYNYGRRMSPTADEVVTFFINAEKNKRKLGQKELLADDYVQPLNAGLSCLAALPSQVQHLLPEPYNTISVENKVEDIYASCMDPETNVFDMELFQRLALSKLDELLKEKGRTYQDLNQKNHDDMKYQGRQVRIGDTFWTVLHREKKPLIHQFVPPLPFSERLSRLRHDNRIHVSHILATDKPRWLRSERRFGLSQKVIGNLDMKYSDIGSLLTDENGCNYTLEEVDYRKAYISQIRPRSTKRRAKDRVDKLTSTTAVIEEESRTKHYNFTSPVSEVRTNVEGRNAIQILQHLINIRILGITEWEHKWPSPSAYAVRSPSSYELVTLRLETSNGEYMFQQDRNVNISSRRLLRHHLGNMAMNRLFGSNDWVTLTLKDMEKHLSPSSSKEKS